MTSVLSAVCRYEQRHHGLLGYAVPAPHLKPLPSGTGTSQTAADAPALSVLGDRRSETLQDGSIRRLSVNTSTCVCVCVCVCAAVQGNNEVSMWDMETGDRKFTLWASSAPPLSEMQV